MSARSIEDVEASKEFLCRLLPRGSTLHLIVRSVAKSGMSRVMTPIVMQISDDSETVWAVYPGRHITTVLSLRDVDDGRNSFRIRGGGMDMGFAVADHLSRVLYGEPGQITHKFL
jgi:hypothetical protein